MAHLPPRLLLIPLFARVLLYWLAIRLILFLFLGPDSLVHTGRSVLVVLVALLLLRAEGFSLSRGGQPILRSARLWASEGQITVMFGRNGSGKSTFLRCTVGLAAADAGILHFGSESHERTRLHQLARAGLFYIPARDSMPRGLPFGLLCRGVSDQFGVEPRRPDQLEKLRVAEFAAKTSGQLSGGERKRCEWALALLRRPRCIVDDDALEGIMPLDQDLLGEVLREESDAGVAIVVTGHEIDRWLQIGDEFVWMEEGSTTILGGREEASHHPLLENLPRGTG